MSRLALAPRLGVPLTVGALVLLSSTAAWAAPSGLTASAKGSTEVGSPGNPTATATATFTADPTNGQFCYTVTATGLNDAAAMHIHKGAAGANGPVVLPLDPKKIGAGKTCTAATGTLLGQIVANPAGFYFNVHTPAFPAGAVRGQLVATSPPASNPTASNPTKVNAGSGGHAADSSGLPVLPAILVLLGLGLSVAGWRLARR